MPGWFVLLAFVYYPLNQYCSMDVRAGRWRWTWIGKSRHLKTNATGGSWAYHTESIKRTNMCDNRSISSPDVRKFYHQPSSVASYHGSAMPVVMIDCRKIILVGGSHRSGRSRKSWKDSIKEWTDRSMSLLPRSLGSHRSGSICRSSPTTPGRHGYWLDWSLILQDSDLNPPPCRSLVC